MFSSSLTPARSRKRKPRTHSYRNVILQALGAHNNIAVEVNSLSLKQLDTLVLCSDGLSGKIHSEEIATIVNDAPDLKWACQGLIDLANWRGGEDNITVVIAQFSGEGLTSRRAMSQLSRRGLLDFLTRRPRSTWRAALRQSRSAQAHTK